MIRKEKYTIYASSDDVTFIMVDTFIDNLLFHTECVGWYHGEPSEQSTETFTGKLKATYEGGL